MGTRQHYEVILNGTENVGKQNSEQILLSTISECHMRCYLRLCSEHGIEITDYRDTATGVVMEHTIGSSQFAEVTLRPVVTVKDYSVMNDANRLHAMASTLSFIANAVNFAVRCLPRSVVSHEVTSSEIH